MTVRPTLVWTTALFFVTFGTSLAVPAPASASASAAPRDEWATITHAGNQAYDLPDSLTGEPTGYLLGRVDHEYQIRKTEVTGGEWWEFVQAYAPYVASNEAISFSFTSQWISAGYGPNNTFVYGFNGYGENRAVNISWRFAARYVNWLHNGKALTQDAFETGVYDTSTWGQDDSGLPTGQSVRSPGATYWMPSEDEWVKAVYFDPDRYGPGQPGYWQYPNRSDVPPVSGPPGEGETSAGWDRDEQFVEEPEVASYASVTTPWGLWDASGSQAEMIERYDISQFYRALGSASGLSQQPAFRDDLDYRGVGCGLGVCHGFRIARAVPSLGSAPIALMLMSLSLNRRRRSSHGGGHGIGGAVAPLERLADRRCSGV